jgi:hypothetical protein
VPYSKVTALSAVFFLLFLKWLGLRLDIQFLIRLMTLMCKYYVVRPVFR